MIAMAKRQKVGKFILVGDFNFYKHSPPYTIVKKRFNFIDPFEKIKHAKKPFDYIFIKNLSLNQVSPTVILKDSFIISQKPYHLSDHYGLALTIR